MEVTSLNFEYFVLVFACVFFGFYIVYFGFMFYQSRHPTSVKKKKWFPFVSLVVATYNEQDTILKKLRNLEELNYPRNKFEIIVVDGASTDATCNIIEQYMKSNPPLRLKLLRQDRRTGKASALNLARKESEGEIFVISDADCLFGQETLTNAISNFSDSSVGAVTGRQVLLNPKQSHASKIEKAYRSFYEVIRRGESRLDSTPIFHGELSAYRSDLLETWSNDSVCDDIEMAMKIRRKGYRTIYDSDAVFYEYAPPSVKARVLQKRRRGQGVIQQLFGSIDMFLRPRYGKYGMVILPAEFFMHVISPILFFPLFALILILAASLFFASPFLFLFLVGATFAGCLIIYPGIFAIVSSFINSQFSLLLGFGALLLGKKSYKWPKVTEIRLLWKIRE